MDTTLIQNLTKTLSACSDACLSVEVEKGKVASKRKTNRLTELLKDCVEICDVTESMVQRESMHHKKMLKFCAELCFKTWDEFLKFDNDDFKGCAEICRSCALECASAT